MQDQAPEMIVQRLKMGRWEVLMTPPGYGCPIRITGFSSESAARAWIARESDAWLARCGRIAA